MDKQDLANRKEERLKKQLRIDKIVAEEMQKVRNQKQKDYFWKYLTVGFSIVVVMVYLGIVFLNNPSSDIRRFLIGRATAFALIAILVLVSPKATYWIIGVEDRGRRRKEFE